MMTKYEKQRYDGTNVFYDITDDGFDIYIGSEKNLVYTQHEPFIPNHSKSYEENAIIMCEDICKEPERSFTMTESMYSEMQSNIDYLMLLNDADSAIEEENE